MNETWETAWLLLRPGERLVIWEDSFSSIVYGLISHPDPYAPLGPLVPSWRGDALSLSALLDNVLRYLRQAAR